MPTLTAEAERALAAPPADQKAALALRFDDVHGRLQVWVTTWDPFEWIADRSPRLVTVGGGSAIVVPFWQLADRSAQSVVDLVEGVVPGATEPTKEIDVESEWEPIGPGLLETITEAAFGPIVLDRSPVAMHSLPQRVPGCAACERSRLGFPGELSALLTQLCRSHREYGAAVLDARFGAAQRSNPTAWEALNDAVARLEMPHLPGGVGRQLLEAAAAEDAATVVAVLTDLAPSFADHPERLLDALGDEGIEALSEDFLALPTRLNNEGRHAEAGQLAELLRPYLPELDGHLRLEVATAGAGLGHADEALALVAEIVDEHDDFVTQLAAGRLAGSLAATELAERALRRARVLAQGLDDWEAGISACETHLALTDDADEQRVIEAELALWSQRRSRAASLFG